MGGSCYIFICNGSYDGTDSYYILADRGQARAQIRIGLGYTCGLSLGRDYAKTVECLGGDCSKQYRGCVTVGVNIPNGWARAWRRFMFMGVNPDRIAAQTCNDGGGQHGFPFLYGSGFATLRDEVLAQTYRNKARVLGYDLKKASIATCSVAI